MLQGERRSEGQRPGEAGARDGADPPEGRPLSDLPYARGLPLLGSALPMLARPIAFLLEEYRRLGPIFRLRAAHHRFTILAGADANALLARTADKYLSAEPSWRAFSSGFGATCILPGADGATHYRLRKIQQRAYSRAAIVRRLPEAAAIARLTFDGFAAGPVALVPLCRKMVTEQLGTLTVGQGPGEYLDDIVRTIRFSMNCHVTNRWPTAMLRMPRFRRARRRYFELAQQILDAHATGRLRSDLLDDVRDAARAEPGLLSETDVLMMATGPFVAGLDTVANTTAFLLHALLRDREAYARAEADADALLADPAALTSERLDAAAALRGAVQETLRLYPIAPMLYRHVAQPVDFAGYRLPAGEPVLFATTMVHVMPEYFPDPYRFDIDRHRDAGSKTSSLICAFGLGPHTCLGSGFAEVQALLIAATLLRYARFELEPGVRSPRLQIDPSLTLGNGYKVRLVARRP
jgi:cytochrome P450